MTGIPRNPNAEMGASALNEWTQHVENVLRGVAHALNNRAAALSALLELSTEPGEDAEEIRSILASELDRVKSLTAAVRAIGAPRGGVEAFAPRDAATEALDALKLHAEHRDRAVVLDAADAPPIRVERWRFVRAVIALCAGADEPTPASADLRLTLREVGEWLEVRLEQANAPGALSAYTAALVASMRGEAIAGSGFRVPTLAAIRRREAR